MSSFLSQQLGPLFGPNMDYEARKLALQKAKVEQANYLSSQSALSKLGLGVDPETGIAWNPSSAPTGNYTDAATGQTQPISSAPPLSSAPGQMNNTRNLLSDNAQQTAVGDRNLLRQAFPDAAQATMQNAAFPPPPKIGFAPAGSQPIDETTGRPIGNRIPDKPDNEPELIKVQDALRTMAPDDPRRPALESWIETNTTLKQREANASITEKNAAAGLANTKGGLLKDGGLDEDTMGRMYEQLQAGQPLNQITGNLGRGQQGANNITKFNNYVTQRMKAAGFNGADIARKNAEFAATKSGMVANEKASANITRAADELSRTADLVEASSMKVDRIGFKPVAELENIARDNTSNPAYGDLAVKIQGVKTAYSQAMARNGVPTDTSRAKADALIATARNHADLMSRINAMRQEANAALQAAGDTSQRLGDRISPSAAQPAPDAPNPGLTPVIFPAGTPSATDPKTGHKVYFVNGRWQ